ITCARHSTFKRNGVIDLPLGERYANIDYALQGALWNLALVKCIILTYDIACQYSTNLVEGFHDYWKKGIFSVSMFTVAQRIDLLVPKMYLQGHKSDCRYRWSLNWTKGTGRTDGERIETTWAEAKQAGGMTKEMNAGHRHDTLNDFFNDWNWSKVQNLGTHSSLS
ncbi:hypothetical protein DFH09DRAFT_909656, partial [Mycena vulgaris]